MAKYSSTPKIISHRTSFDEIADLLQGRKEVILNEKSEIQKALQQVREANFWPELSAEDRERPLRLVELHLEDVDAGLLYIDAQIEMLMKAKNALSTNDIEAIKLAVKEYVISDMNMALKNISMLVYDTNDVLMRLKELLAEEGGQ
jgi:hypothetical protein